MVQWSSLTLIAARLELCHLTYSIPISGSSTMAGGPGIVGRAISLVACMQLIIDIAVRLVP
jgi:hypothetical protein